MLRCIGFTLFCIVKLVYKSRIVDFRYKPGGPTTTVQPFSVHSFANPTSTEDNDTNRSFHGRRLLVDCQFLLSGPNLFEHGSRHHCITQRLLCVLATDGKVLILLTVLLVLIFSASFSTFHHFFHAEMKRVPMSTKRNLRFSMSSCLASLPSHSFKEHWDG